MTSATKHDFASVVMLFVMGSLGALIPYMSTDDAVKYIDPAVRFWIIAGAAALLGGISTIKAFITIPKNGMGTPISTKQNEKPDTSTTPTGTP